MLLAPPRWGVLCKRLGVKAVQDPQISLTGDDAQEHDSRLLQSVTDVK